MNTATYNSTAMSNLWNYLKGLPLSIKDRQWLANRLIESAENMKSKSADAVKFPHIGSDFKPSAEVLAMSCGPLPEGFDVEKELDKMWEERAK